MQDTIWTCADGRKILVSQMDTEHIVNAIRLIQRRSTWRRKYLDRLQLELEIRAIKREE